MAATNPPEPLSDSRTVPILQAGGGHPSALESATTIESFSSPILSYLRTVYQSLADGDNSLSKSGAIKFLTDIQKEDSGTASVFAESNSLTNADVIDQSKFLMYMASPRSNAMSLPKNHDLTRPISNYFISTSHNTYLSGNQLFGDASTQAYTNVLVRGCRCLEIDVWNGEPKSLDDSNGDADDDEMKPEGGENAAARPGHKRTDSRWERLKARANEAKDQATDAAANYKERQEQKKSTTTSSGAISASHWSAPGGPSEHTPKHRAEPRVLHGHTLTKEVPFRAVCNAIRDSAFIATDLPIIVSLEVHACLEQQEIMVEIMREAWQGMLIDIGAKERLDILHLPSPDQLRRKILIKVKCSSEAASTEAGQALPDSNNPLGHVTSTSSDEDQSATGVRHVTPSTQQKRKKASKILRELSELGVYTRAYSFKSFNQPESKIPTHVFSLSEQKVLDEDGPQLFRHNRNYLMRVFPSGLRINSSNVEPTFLWRQGAQMVALNWQKCDKGMMLNEGMFAGESGWVLKPQGYHSTVGQKSKSPEKQVAYKKLNLTIELLAGQDIPLPQEREESHFARFQKFRPYVKAQLHVDNKAMTRVDASESSDDEVGKTDDKRQNARKDKSVRAEEREDTSSKLKRRSRAAKTTDPDFLGETLRWTDVEDIVDELTFLR